MCGGFTCTKNALKALNLLYIVVSFILITVSTYGKAAEPIISNISIFSYVLACGVFLFLLSLLGLVGTAKHHQVMLFFYMLILFILFVVQFSVAFACLVISNAQKLEIAKASWKSASNDSRHQAQQLFDCCGFSEKDAKDATLCPNVHCCQGENCKQCEPCENAILHAIGNALSFAGWIGMLFSFTEFVGVWLTVRYRNQKNPRANPNVFL